MFTVYSPLSNFLLVGFAGSLPFLLPPAYPSVAGWLVQVGALIIQL